MDLIVKFDLRQVPKEIMTTTSDRKHSILLIGSGRLAKHLFHWNSRLEKPNAILTWDRSQDPHLLNQFLNKTNIVWLAISDSALVSFYEKNLAALDHTVVHFSGALHDSRMISAHPMMTFPDALLEDNTYNEIFFGLTGATDLKTALPNFKNSFFEISEQHKALYHALCVTSGNFPQMLWLESEKQFSKLNVPTEAFHTYIKQVLTNYINLKEKSLTGPLIRKDLQTIEKNETSLIGSKLKSIYHSFVKEFLA